MGHPIIVQDDRHRGESYVGPAQTLRCDRTSLDWYPRSQYGVYGTHKDL